MWTTGARTLGGMAVTTSPPARRLRTDRRDLRLAVGVALVVVSVLLGARLLATAGDRVPVWTARSALAAGTTLRADDLVAVAVASDALGAYVPTSGDVVGKVLTRAVGAGELVPAGALGDAAAVDRRMVTVAVDPLHAPPGLARGERVELRGFGAFTVKHRTARQGRNPRTGDSVAVDEKFVPFFKTGKELRERLNAD